MVDVLDAQAIFGFSMTNINAKPLNDFVLRLIIVKFNKFVEAYIFDETIILSPTVINFIVYDNKYVQIP